MNDRELDRLIRDISSQLSRFLRLFCICLIPYLYDYIVSYCPKKPRWKTQTMCSLIIQALTGMRFHSIRPDWLKNPITGRNMEIDDFSEELMLGLEYNGVQHYQYTPRFHQEKYCQYYGRVATGMEHFELQVFRDEVKKSLCDEHGITLIIVPYTVKPGDLVSYILHKLAIVQEHRKWLKNRYRN